MLGRRLLVAGAAFFLLGTPGLRAQQLPDQIMTAAGPGGPLVQVFVGAGPSPFMMLLRSANLTSTQQAQVQQVLQSQGEQNRALIQQLQAIEAQISEKLLGAATVAAADLSSLEQQASQIKQQMDQNMIDASLAIRNLLTPDQLRHLAQVHQQLDGLRGQIEKLIGPGPGGPGGPVVMPPG